MNPEFRELSVESGLTPLSGSLSARDGFCLLYTERSARGSSTFTALDVLGKRAQPGLSAHQSGLRIR